MGEALRWAALVGEVAFGSGVTVADPFEASSSGIVGFAS